MTKRIQYYDVLNVLACYAVVLLHHNGIVHDFSPSQSWNQALLVEVLFYFAVPIFWMLSGATLLNYRERYTTVAFLKKRLIKTIVPYVIWQLIWFALHYLRGNPEFLTLHSFVDGFINNRFQPVYWFFSSIIILYILMPILSLLRGNKRLLLYLIAVLVFLSGVVSPVFEICNIRLSGYYSSAIFSPVMFSLLGYYFSQFEIKTAYKYLIYSTAIIMLFIRYTITFTMSYSIGTTYDFLFSYSYITAIFPALSLFILAKDLLNKRTHRLIDLCTNISAYSLGIYLIHKLVMFVEFSILNNYINQHSFIWRVPMSLVTWSISLIIVALLKKSKVGRLIFP